MKCDLTTAAESALEASRRRPRHAPTPRFTSSMSLLLTTYLIHVPLHFIFIKLEEGYIVMCLTVTCVIFFCSFWPGYMANESAVCVRDSV